MTGRVLVTGGGGFVGRSVVPQLADAGYEVHAVQRSAAAFDVASVVAHRADLLDAQAVRALVERVRPSHLLHLAWVTSPQHYGSASMHRAWVEASLGLLAAFATQGGRRAVIAGSLAEHAQGLAYGAAKTELRERAAVHAADGGYGVAWARLFSPYGPHERPDRLVPTVVRGLLASRPVELSHGRQRLDFVFVDDAADALVRLLDSELTGVAEVGSGKARPVRDVAEAIAARVGGHELLRFGARADDGPALEWSADITRLRDELGWEPRVPLGDGIERTTSWWRRRGLT